MNKSWWYRFSFMMLVVFTCVVLVTPTIFNVGENSKLPFKTKVNLGLDLQGGLYMILGIDFNKVYRDEIRNAVIKSQSILKDQGISVKLGDLNASDPNDPQMQLVLDNPSDADKAKDHVRSYFASLVRLTAEKSGVLTYGLTNTLKTTVQDQSVTKSIEVIRNRIDEFGVTEPEILAQGKDRIVVQLPGVKDIERAKELMGKTAKLEFKIVNDNVTGGQLQDWITKAEKTGIIHVKGASFSEYLNKLNDFLRAELPKG
ncbi:MAG: hypothetical protein WCG27_05695, partial [Pseudomonadota bacterium]